MVRGVSSRAALALTVALLAALPTAAARAQPAEWTRVQAIRLAVYEDTPTAMEALERGEVDVVLSYLDDYAEVKLLAPHADGVRVPARLWALELNVGHEPGHPCRTRVRVIDPNSTELESYRVTCNVFADPEVRLAFADLVLAKFVHDWAPSGVAPSPGELWSWQNETWVVNRLPIPLETPWWNLTARAANLSVWASSAPDVGEALARFNRAMDSLASKVPGLRREGGRWTFEGRPVLVRVALRTQTLPDRTRPGDDPSSGWSHGMGDSDPLRRGWELVDAVKGLLEDLGFEVAPEHSSEEILSHDPGDGDPLVVVSPVPPDYGVLPDYAWLGLLYHYYQPEWAFRAADHLDLQGIWEPIFALMQGLDLDGEPCSSLDCASELLGEVVRRGLSAGYPYYFLLEEYDWVPYSPDRVQFAHLSAVYGPLDALALATALTDDGSLVAAVPRDGVRFAHPAPGMGGDGGLGWTVPRFDTFVWHQEDRYPSLWEFRVSPFHDWNGWPGWLVHDLVLFQPAVTHPTLLVRVPIPGVGWRVERSYRGLDYTVEFTWASWARARDVAGDLSLEGLTWWDPVRHRPVEADGSNLAGVVELRFPNLSYGFRPAGEEDLAYWIANLFDMGKSIRLANGTYRPGDRLRSVISWTWLPRGNVVGYRVDGMELILGLREAGVHGPIVAEHLLPPAGAVAASSTLSQTAPFLGVPWEVEEAAHRVAGSEPWAVVNLLNQRHALEIADELERMASEGYVPPQLEGLVSPEEAAQRYRDLARLIRERGHAVFSDGPFRVEAILAQGILLVRNDDWPGWSGLEDWLDMDLEDVFSDGLPGPTQPGAGQQPQPKANQSSPAAAANQTQPTTTQPPAAEPGVRVRSWPLLALGLVGLLAALILALYWRGRG